MNGAFNIVPIRDSGPGVACAILAAAAASASGTACAVFAASSSAFLPCSINRSTVDCTGTPGSLGDIPNRFSKLLLTSPCALPR